MRRTARSDQQPALRYRLIALRRGFGDTQL